MNEANAVTTQRIGRRHFLVLLALLAGAGGGTVLFLANRWRAREEAATATPTPTDPQPTAAPATETPLPPTETPTPTPTPTPTSLPGVRDLVTAQVRGILEMAADLSARVSREREGEIVDSLGRIIYQNFCPDVETRIAENDVVIFAPLLVVLHWDSVPDEIENPTTDQTIRGLGAGKSVQFCVDSRPHYEGGVTQSTRIPIGDPGQFLAYNADHVLAVVSNNGVMNYLSLWEAACAGGDFLLPELDDLAHNAWETPMNDLAVGIESTGHHYTFANLPADQQTANMLAAVAMLMKTYRIPLQYIVGHHDIQEGKPDIGNEYASLMRLLVLLYALDRRDEALLDLIPVVRDSDPRVVIGDYFAGPFGRFTQARLGDEGVAALLTLAFCYHDLQFCG
jgi:hypothetical protein